MGGLLTYIVRRVLLGVPVFFGVSILTFALANAAGNPINLIRLGLRNVNPQVLEALARYYGIDKPLYERYFIWLGNLLQGNLGVSLSGQPVAQAMWVFVGPTLELQIGSLLLALAIGIPVGVYSARRQYSKGDLAITTTAIFGVSLPTFWLGLVLIVVFSFFLNWLPSSGAFGITRLWWGHPVLDHLAHLILPLAVLTYVSLAYIVRLLRGSMLEVLRQDYVLAARASGLPERSVIYGQALRNAISPIVTVVGLSFALSLAGAPALETTFGWPGLGYLFVQSAFSLDVPMVQGITIVITLMVLALTIITDVVYGVVDPRVRIR